jgi:hypothetical protein
MDLCLPSYISSSPLVTHIDSNNNETFPGLSLFAYPLVAPTEEFQILLKVAQLELREVQMCLSE